MNCTAVIGCLIEQNIFSLRLSFLSQVIASCNFIVGFRKTSYSFEVTSFQWPISSKRLLKEFTDMGDAEYPNYGCLLGNLGRGFALRSKNSLRHLSLHRQRVFPIGTTFSTPRTPSITSRMALPSRISSPHPSHFLVWKFCIPNQVFAS